MISPEALASLLADVDVVCAVAPRACPCDFGPDRRYELLELIGIGRDSHVYLARDRHMSSDQNEARVAIKIRESGASAREEAVSGRSVTHPHVVRVLDHGVSPDGATYLVEELMPGGDLSDLGAPLPPRRAAALIRDTARGVQALHSAGITHGDLKPSNVLLDGDGVVKVADFDLAFHERDQLAIVGGNLAFMSPERVEAPTARAAPPSDIYALGGLLSYLLTGALPNGEGREEILKRHEAGLGPEAPGIERDLDRIVCRAMSVDPELRHCSGQELAEDLRDWLEVRPIRWTKPPLARRAGLLLRRRPVHTLALGALIVASSLGGMLWWRITTERARHRRVQIDALIDAQADSLELARQEVEAYKRAGRQLIETIAESGMLGMGARNGANVLPFVAWLSWFVSQEMVFGGGTQLAPGVRIDGLRSILDAERSAAREDGLVARLVTVCLAHELTLAGQMAEAIPLATEASEWAGETLGTTDPARIGIETTLECARALQDAQQWSEDEIVSAIERFEARSVALMRVPYSEPARLLVQSTIERLRVSPSSLTSGAAEPASNP
ncbi:MAG: serine/threonine protein kinase [Phycisphaeraceae bacterium]|nr:serine/threonine protein kinase [Phycisphaeraceae bacterium]